MGTQFATKCLTSNCTKKTTHESGICHLHRKRRVNARGDIEYCFPSICYFKSDVTIGHLDVRRQPKRRKKQKQAPVKLKSFADLEGLLTPNPEPAKINGQEKKFLDARQRPCERNSQELRPLKQKTVVADGRKVAPCQANPVENIDPEEGSRGQTIHGEESRGNTAPGKGGSKKSLWGRVSGFFRRGG